MERYKTVKEKKELYIEFTDEEIEEMGWEENQKLSMSLTEDGGIMIKPFVKVDIDISDWPKEIFEFLIQKSLEEDKTINQVIIDLLEDSFKYYKV
jgi:hypothetical protein